MAVDKEVIQLTRHEKATAIADKLRNIRLDVVVTAEDVLLKCENDEELNFYFHWCCNCI